MKHLCDHQIFFQSFLLLFTKKSIEIKDTSDFPKYNAIKCDITNLVEPALKAFTIKSSYLFCAVHNKCPIDIFSQ